MMKNENKKCKMKYIKIKEDYQNGNTTFTFIIKQNLKLTREIFSIHKRNKVINYSFLPSTIKIDLL